MMRLIYWMAVTACVALIVHIGVVIFLPRQEMSRRIDVAAARNGINALTVWGPDAQAVLGYHPGDAVYAFCPFDLRDGRLIFDALMPATKWTVTIYSARGGVLYAVNSRQAGVDNFQLSVRRAPDFLTQITAEADSGINDGWQVSATEDRGLIVVWAAAQEPFQRSAIAKDLARSRCSLEAQ
jgi:uncharacterized membrane protein